MLLTLLRWTGTVGGVLFGLFALACSLYVLAEWIETNTHKAGRSLRWCNTLLIALFFLLYLFEGFPLSHCLFAIMTQFIYRVMLSSFPVIPFLSAPTLIAAVMTCANHWLWTVYFQRRRVSDASHDFKTIASFFAICIWSMPFLLFLSMSAGDLHLPRHAHLSTPSEALHSPYQQLHVQVETKESASQNVIKRALQVLTDLW